MFTRSHSDEPKDKAGFTARFDGVYSRFAGVYDVAVRRLPVWKTWLNQALPHIQGPRVLEVSFGTGYLLTQYAGRVQCVGLDLNARMIATARRNARACGIDVPLLRGDAARLPFRDESFDCIVNTMAFSGYPDAAAVLDEYRRVLSPGGRLVMVDIAYPAENRRGGILLVNLWKLAGDLVRDVPALLDRHGFRYREEEIGGWGSVHLYIAEKQGTSESRQDAAT